MGIRSFFGLSRGPEREPGKDPDAESEKKPDAKADVEQQEQSLDADAEAARELELRLLTEALSGPTSMSPEAGLNVVATFDAKAITEDLQEELEILAGDYGLSTSELDDKDKGRLAALWLGVKQGKTEGGRFATAEALESDIGDLLFEKASGKMERLTEDLRTKGAETFEELEAKLESIMRSISGAAKSVPINEDTTAKWREIDYRYRELIHVRKGWGPEVAQAFEKILNRYEDFIEYDLVTFRMENDRVDIQKVTQELYGRTAEEVEAIKRDNRVASAEKIRELSGKPQLEIADLEELHRINNRGIVPKKFARVRNEQGAMPPTFGERMGTMPEDLRPALDEMLESANRLRSAGTEEQGGPFTKNEYAIAAAQLHNQLLDMHPWSDRNGSTALLFLETLMTKAGYQPPAEREKEFYKNLGNILDNDPVAMTVVAEEMIRMKSEPGFLEGKFNEDPAKKKKYRNILNFFRGQARKEAIEWGDDESE